MNDTRRIETYNLLGLLYEREWNYPQMSFALWSNTMFNWPLLKLEFLAGPLILNREQIFSHFETVCNSEDWESIFHHQYCDFDVLHKFNSWILSTPMLWLPGNSSPEQLFDKSVREIEALESVLRLNDLAIEHQKLSSSGFIDDVGL